MITISSCINNIVRVITDSKGLELNFGVRLDIYIVMGKMVSQWGLVL
jgi:hypothetical protein